MARNNVKCIPESQQPGYLKLVELHSGNEADAFQEWEDNGGKVPARATALVAEKLDGADTMADEVLGDPKLISKQSALRRAKATMASKIKSLERIAEKHGGLAKVRDEMRDLMAEIDTISSEEALINFIGIAERLSKTSENWMKNFKEDKTPATFENLKRIEEAISSFSLLKDLSHSMFESDVPEGLFQAVDDTIARYGEVHKDYINLSRKLLSESLQGDFHKVIRIYEKKAEKLFNQMKKPHLDKAEVPAARADFIARYLATNAMEIEVRTAAYIDNMLLHTVDVPALTALAVNPKDMNHDIVSIALESLDNADMEVWNNMETVIDDSEYINDEFVKFVGKNGDPKKQYEALLIRDENGEVEAELMNRYHPDYLAFQKKYKDVPAIWNMHKHLTGLCEAKDAMVYKSARLGYKLPILEQTNLERMYSRGLVSAIKEGVIDQKKLRAKDVELGLISSDDLLNAQVQEQSNTEETYVGESGEERAVIPLHYRNVTIDPADQTFDIMRAVVLDYHNSMRFKTKLESGVFLGVLKDVISDADITQTTSWLRKLKVNKDTKELHSKKGDGSQLIETLDSLIRHRIYGIKIEGDAKTAKIAQSLGKYTSFLTMSANALSGSANLLHGTTMSWIEALGGDSGYFSTRDRAKAVKQYNLDIVNMMGDVGERRPKSKVNLLSRRFNAMSESHILNGRSYVQNNKVKRIAETSALLGFNSIGEHAMQSIVMLSTLNNIKVKNVNGDFLDKDFKPTTDRAVAIGIADAMTVTEDGSLEFNPIVNSTERTKGVKQEDITKISRMIRRINHDLYGNYDTENKARYQRHPAGALVSQMRGWLVPGLQKRWRGMGTAGTFRKDYTKVGDRYDVDLSTLEGLAKAQTMSFNTEIGEFEEGQYVTTILYLRTAISEIKALGIIAGNKETWNAMDDQQKGNVKKTIIEIGLIVGFFMMSKAFEDDPDDPDDMHNIYMAYMARRMYSELFTFANPQETVRTFRSPAIAISSVENALNVLTQGLSPTETYKGGRHTGEYKLWRDIKKLIPVYKQIDRNVEDSYNFLTR